MDRHRDFVEAHYLPVLQLGQFMSLFVNMNANLPAEFRNTEPADFIPRRLGSAEPKLIESKPAQADDGSYRMSLWEAYAAGQN